MNIPNWVRLVSKEAEMMVLNVGWHRIEALHEGGRAEIKRV